MVSSSENHTPFPETEQAVRALRPADVTVAQIINLFDKKGPSRATTYSNLVSESHNRGQARIIT
jgi:hypothetical protein